MRVEPVQIAAGDLILTECCGDDRVQRDLWSPCRLRVRPLRTRAESTVAHLHLGPRSVPRLACPGQVVGEEWGEQEDHGSVPSAPAGEVLVAVRPVLSGDRRAEPRRVCPGLSGYLRFIETVGEGGPGAEAEQQRSGHPEGGFLLVHFPEVLAGD